MRREPKQHSESRSPHPDELARIHYNLRMATGRHHAIATAVVGGALSAGLYMLAHCPLPETVLFACGCLTGLVINPDLDIRRSTHAVRVVRNSTGQLGQIFGWLWYLLWWPYAYLIPRHRHPLSHLPVIGTAGRLLYLGVFLAAAYALLDWFFVLPALTEFPAPALNLLAWWAGGLGVIDTLHVLLDTRPGIYLSKRIFNYQPLPAASRRRSPTRPQAAQPTRLSRSK